MRLICSAIVLVAPILLLPPAHALDDGQAAPCLGVAETSWSFETVTEGEKPEHTFVVENTGRAKLTISRVLHSCGGCFEVELGAKELEPGEKADMKLVVLTARRHGEFRKYLYIESNDPKLSRKRITVTGTIKPREDSASGTASETEPEESLTVELDKGAVEGRCAAEGRHPVCITYLTSSGCEECRATEKALDRLRKAYPSIAVREFDIDKLDEFAVLLEMEKAHGRFEHSPPVMYVGTTLLDGWGEVKRKLGPTVNARLEDGKAAEWPPEVAGTSGSNPPAFELISARFNAIGLVAIVSAGLVDGINPCAFATIVFFVSLLARFGKSRRETIVVRRFRPQRAR